MSQKVQPPPQQMITELQSLIPSLNPANVSYLVTVLYLETL